MERKTPHCKLPAVQKLVKEGKVRTTISALAGAASLGLNFHEMVAVIKALTMQEFYKSMTTHADNKIWQDVYRPTTTAGEVYLKLTVIDDVVIVSFKEL